MGLFDKAKSLLRKNAKQVEDGLEKAAELVDDKTGKKYTEQIDSGAAQAKEFIENLEEK